MPLNGAVPSSRPESPTISDDRVERRKAAARERAIRSYHARKAANPETFLAEKRVRETAYRKADPEKTRAAGRATYERNKDRYREKNRARSIAYSREARKRDPEKYKAACERWRKANMDTVRAAARRNWHKYMQCPEKSFRARVSALVRMSLKRGTKSGSIDKILDYTVEELRAHIERQFVDGMGWHNMGSWHIDHIIPVSAFKFTSDQDPEFKRAWHITNLRPLWGYENVRKSNRVTHLL